jgi:hypothetical protein
MTNDIWTRDDLAARAREVQQAKQIAAAPERIAATIAHVSHDLSGIHYWVEDANGSRVWLRKDRVQGTEVGTKGVLIRRGTRYFFERE